MELRLLLHLVKKNFLIVALITSCSVIGALGFSLRKPTYFDVSVSLVTNYEQNTQIAQNQNGENFYKFDGFYAFQASERFSQVVAGILKSASATKDIYSIAGIPLDEKKTTINALSTMFKPQKQTERVVEVRFSAKTMEQAEKLAKALETFMGLQADTVSKSVEGGRFTVIAGTPVIVEQRSLWLLFSLIGLLGGLFLALVVILVIHYW